jgi:hypothetical protein
MKTTTIFLIIIILLIFFLFISYLVLNLTSKKVDITEIAKLNPDEITMNVIKNQECRSIVKKEEYWLVDECKDDIYFKLFLKNGGYYLGYCTSWSTPREAFQKLSFLLGRECLNETAQDTEFDIKSRELKAYYVCGLRIFFRDECIVMVIR